VWRAVGETTGIDPFEAEPPPSPGLGFRKPADFEADAHLLESCLPKEQGFLLKEVIDMEIDARKDEGFDPSLSPRG